MKSKKVLSCILTMVMAATLFVGCGNDTTQTSAEGTAEIDDNTAITNGNETEAESLSEDEIAALYEADGYHLLWHDEFDGDTLNEENWNIELREPGWTNNELQAYTDSAENVFVKDGNLILKALKGKNDKGLTGYTSGKVNSKDKRPFLYGKVVVRAKVPAGQGLWPAIWMMPQDESFYGQWPKCGEIDIMEILGHQTNTLYSNIHYGLPHGENQGTYVLEGTTFYDDFHEFSLEWEPDEMRFYLDGELFHTVNNWYTAIEGEDEVTYPAPFDQPFFVQLNLAVGGDWPGNPDGTTDFERAEFAIDYVRVYQQDSYDDTNVVKPSSVMHDPDETGNYVRNADFSVVEDLSDEVDWKFLLAYGGVGEAKIENNEMIITSSNAGTEDYSVQLVQPSMPIEKGGVYKVTFEAMAEEEREMKVAVTAPEVSWIRYLEDTSLTMTPNWQTYEFEFTMQNDNDAKGRLEFNMGNQGATATIHIKNVRLERTGSAEVERDDFEKTIRSDGNYVYNGTFQYGEGRLKYWQIEKTEENAIIGVTNENLVRRFHSQVPEGVNDLQAVKLVQPKLAMVGGATYNLTFDAFGDKSQTIQVAVGSQVFDVALTEENSSYSYSVTLPKGEDKPDLVFALGVEGNIYIDNVKIKEDGALINASFSNGLVGWEPFTDSTVASYVTYAVDSLSEDDAAGFTIENTGEQNWHIQLMQKNISLYKGKKYKLSFDAKCSIDRSIELAAQRNGSQDDVWTEYGKASFELTNEYKTYSLEFEMAEENNLAAMITFSMGAIDGEVITDSHVIYIDNVVLLEQ